MMTIHFKLNFYFFLTKIILTKVEEFPRFNFWQDYVLYTVPVVALILIAMCPVKALKEFNQIAVFVMTDIMTRE